MWSFPAMYHLPEGAEGDQGGRVPSGPVAMYLLSRDLNLNTYALERVWAGTFLPEPKRQEENIAKRVIRPLWVPDRHSVR